MIFSNILKNTFFRRYNLVIITQFFIPIQLKRMYNEATKVVKFMKKIMLFLAAFMLMFSCIQPKASAASYDKATTKQTVKVYQKAGSSYRVLYTIPKGKAVKVIGGVDVGTDNHSSYQYKDGFYKVTYKNKKGYVKQGTLKFKNPYTWVPGVKKKALKYAKSYSLGKYRLVKAEVWDTEGIYYVETLFEGKWHYVGYVSCKTGYAHG